MGEQANNLDDKLVKHSTCAIKRPYTWTYIREYFVREFDDIDETRKIDFHINKRNDHILRWNERRQTYNY